MIAKVFKVVWFVSLLAMMGVFLYSYASWPEFVKLSEQEEGLAVDKSMLFYSCLGLVALFNSFGFIIGRLRFSDEFGVWLYGLIISFHFFFVSGFIFITIFNSLEKYNYSMMGPTLYASIILLIIWSAGWPIYYLYKRINTQAKLS